LSHIALMLAYEEVCAQYVDYSEEESTGFMRFDIPGGHKKLTASFGPEGRLTIVNHLVAFEVLGGTIPCCAISCALFLLRLLVPCYRWALFHHFFHHL